MRILLIPKRGFHLQQLKVVQTVVNWDHHQLGEDILDGFFEALCN